jgi:hypothetical protein
VVGKSFLFQGYFHQPGKLIRLQILTDPARDPAVAANWAQFATATSSTTPTTVAGPDPLYPWSVNAAPVPSTAVAARWPQGGLARVRAIHSDPANGDTVLTTFDAVTFSACLAEQQAAGADWATIGTACAGLGRGTAALVSTSTVPVAAGTAASLGGFLGRKGRISTSDTLNYYIANNLPTSLAGFQATFGFPTDEVTATYYSDRDLGLGREAHCKAIAGGGVACYITNYSGVIGQAAFHVDPATVLADAVARIRSFATFAMIYTGAPGPNAVKFAVYDASGNFATTAQLDSTGNNRSIPNACLSCHGINAGYDAASFTVSGDARFLPFDPFGFTYSTAAGFTFADQADALRRLNALVMATDPAPATAELIRGIYAPAAVTDPGAVANDGFVPDAWKLAGPGLDGTALYRGLVKVGCRTCHVSAVDPAFDFDARADFDAQIGAIRDDVCGPTHIMPHAERPMKKLWTSGARAYLVTGYSPASYPDPRQACKP